MNVILIISDTMRRDCLGCYGAPAWSTTFKTGIGRVHTPHFDRFAEKAHVFDNAFIASFPTVPTRNDILTGRYTWTYKPWAPLGDEVTLQDCLNRAGVVTGLVADTPHPFAPGFNYQRGFQSWELIRGQEHDPWHADPQNMRLPAARRKLRSPDRTVMQYMRNMRDRRWEEDYFPARTFREAARWLERNYQREPFFLYIDTFDPHEPWDPPQYYVDLYDPGYRGESVIYPAYDRCSYLTQAELNHCRALYAGEVTMVDHWFGFLFDRIDSLGLLKNTTVIFVSDHGFYLGEHGYIGKSIITPKYQQAIPLYPEVARIPLLVYTPPPRVTKRKTPSPVSNREHVPVQTVDLMPTICDLLGAQIPDIARSISFAGTLKGEATERPEFVICSPTLSHANLEIPHPTSRASVYASDWLLVYGSQVHDVFDLETTQMVDSLMRRIRTLEKGTIHPELYDLRKDPAASRNIIGKHREAAVQMHSKLVQFMEEHDVPERHLRFFRTI